jgi:phenylalanyl-tRNA synthetase beta chain
MRPSMLPNLVAALQRNADRGRDDLALFEVAPTYASDRPEGQQTVAGGARRSRPKRHWSKSERVADAFTAKADAIAALEAAGAKIDQLQTTTDAPPWYHPGRSGVLRFGPKLALAHFGEVHPRVLKAMDVEGPVHAFEVFLDAIPAPRPRATKSRPALDASELLLVRRDFAFVVDEKITADALLKAVRGADKKYIADVGLFDVYQGKGVETGRKSMAVEVSLQPRDKTLTDEEIDAISKAIVASVGKTTGGVLRA